MAQCRFDFVKNQGMIPTPEEKKEPETVKDPWCEDIEERGYYYDDAHGYQIYEDTDQEEDPVDDAPAEIDGSS